MDRLWESGRRGRVGHEETRLRVCWGMIVGTAARPCPEPTGLRWLLAL
jgi:hypothetical protein